MTETFFECFELLESSGPQADGTWSFRIKHDWANCVCGMTEQITSYWTWQTVLAHIATKEAEHKARSN